MFSQKIISIGGVKIGGKHPVVIQSMTNTDTRNVPATVKQIRSLIVAGCEIIRLAIPDATALVAFEKIRTQVPNIPLVADIHFDHRLALAAVKAGADKIRINPGNLGGHSTSSGQAVEKLKAVVTACQKKNIPIRVGVNAGSLEKNLTTQKTATALVESAVKNVRAIERLGYRNLVVSAKASSAPVTIAAYRKLAKLIPYPLHLGVTEAGSRESGVVKSAVALGALLAEKIGDTIRISLTASPEEEVKVCWNLLRALELRKRGVNIVSCPTCGRTEVDLITLVAKVEKAVEKIERPLTVAVMGCVVNGPGEAAHADFALIGGKQKFALMRAGKLVQTVSEKNALPELLKLIRASGN